jgi:predicted transcriptional regulator
VGIRRRGYFPKLNNILQENMISASEVVSATNLTSKSVNRMLRGSEPSLVASVEKVVRYLRSRGLEVTMVHFVEEEGE